MNKSLERLIGRVISNGQEGIISGTEVVFPDHRIPGSGSISFQFVTMQAARDFRNAVNAMITSGKLLVSYSKVDSVE